MGSSSTGVRDDRPHLYVRTYVWQLPIRVVHWLIVAAIGVLAFTGVYIHNPFIVAVGGGAYVMGTVRYVHMIAGYVLLASFVWRLYYFFAGNRWARWREYVPTRKERFTSMSRMFKYYTFQRWFPVAETGHNGLAGFAYLGLYTMIAVQIITGLVLLDHVGGNEFLHMLVGWIAWRVDIQWMRAIHYFSMFLFLCFFISHVYIAIIVSREEKAGLLESIFTGYKYLRPTETKSE